MRNFHSFNRKQGEFFFYNTMSPERSVLHGLESFVKAVFNVPNKQDGVGTINRRLPGRHWSSSGRRNAPFWTCRTVADVDSEKWEFKRSSRMHQNFKERNCIFIWYGASHYKHNIYYFLQKDNSKQNTLFHTIWNICSRYV